jgi:zeaxanthin glucosyltransferase
MANIVFGVLPYVGHYNPVIKVAQDLRDRGHQITFVSTEGSTGEYVGQYGFGFYKLQLPEQEMSHFSSLPLVGRIQMARRMMRAIDQMLVEGDVPKAMFRYLSPNLLVLENTLAAYAVSAVPFGKPIVLITSVVSMHKKRGLPPIDSNLLPGKGPVKRMQIELSWMRHFMRRRVDRLLAGSLDRTAIRLIRKQNGNVNEIIDRDRYLCFAPRLPEVVLCPAAFDFPSYSIPHCRCCGPSILEKRPEVDFDWSWRDERKPLIYCALGSIVTAQSESKARGLLTRIVEAFRNEPGYDVLVATGAVSLTSTLPGHIRTVSQAPQLEALRRASLFICHAGTGSIKESIWCGVPLLVFPFFGDTCGNAARVQYHGLGERANYKRTNAQDILTLSKRILSGKQYREKVRTFQLLFTKAEKQQNAADYLESLLN